VFNVKLQTQQNMDFAKLKTVGKAVPESVMIFIDDEKVF
jgi:hypothetical protein